MKLFIGTFLPFKNAKGQEPLLSLNVKCVDYAEFLSVCSAKFCFDEFVILGNINGITKSR